MSEQDRGTDRAGRRRKRFLTPQQKYEIFLQLVRQETTIAEAADQAGIDRTTVMKLRTVAKQGVRGHEKVPTGGQIEVPTGGQVAVPTSR